MSPEHPCSGCGALNRRTFLSQTTLAAVAALLADACGTGVWDPVSPQTTAIPSTGLTFTLASYPQLAMAGGIVRVTDSSGAPLALVRTGAATFIALSLACPHQGTTVNLSGTGFLCPNHGARFDYVGTWNGGQATANLTQYPVAYSAATGMLTIAAPAAATPPVVSGTSLLVTVASVPALANVGGIARVDGNTSKPVALVRTGTTTFVALSMVCPHQGATITVQSGGFICSRHGARFGTSGTWLSGQRTSDLVTLASTFNSTTGIVTINTSNAPTKGRDD